MVHHETSIKILAGGVSVFLFGDLQFGAAGFDNETWDQFTREFKATPNALALGLGDYGDWLRPTMRARLQGATAGDDSARGQLDDMVRSDQDKKGGILEKMDFLKGKLIGLHSGHHEWEWGTGGNSTQRLCSALKAPYLGWMASTRLRLGYGSDIGRRSHTYTMLTTHGTGNGRFIGSDVSWMERNIVASWDADFYARGHGCKAATWQPFERKRVRRMGPVGVDESVPNCMLVGGFCKSYTDGFNSTYAERAGYAPQPISWGLLRLTITESNKSMATRGLDTSDKHKVKSLRVETIIRGPDTPGQ